MAHVVVGVSGASGAPLAHKAIALITSLGYTVDLVMTKHAFLTAIEEMGKEFGTPEKYIQSFPEQVRLALKVHALHDFTASIASGTYPTLGMLIIPCSMASLAAIACGLSDNLLRRAADVTLKERRRLVIVPREAPLSEIHLENMLKLSRMGVVFVPPMPAWYMRPQTVSDIEDFIVARSVEALGIQVDYPRWM